MTDPDGPPVTGGGSTRPGGTGPSDSGPSDTGPRQPGQPGQPSPGQPSAGQPSAGQPGQPGDTGPGGDPGRPGHPGRGGDPDAVPGTGGGEARDPLAHTLALLAEAAVHPSRVRVRRWMRGANTFDGFVVAVSPAWTLLARLEPDTVQLDGYVALRTPDISRVTVWLGARETFAIRALRLAGEWPPAVPDPFPLDSTAAVLAAAATMAPLVHVETELEDPDEAYVGRVLRITDEELLLQEIDGEAEWDPEPEPFALEDITLVDVGGRYEAALYAVGGEPPAS